jgi:NAD(P)-dependent dehydrogenase (short-subunit alcohol dehydrogenase family)
MSGNAIYPDLPGKIVFITGGASGIGAAMVRAFCRQGSVVAFADILADEARRLVDSIDSEGSGKAHFLPCDLRSIASLENSIRSIEERWGPIQVLVNNAGNDDRHDINQVTPEYWDERIALNQRHFFFACRAVFPQMAKQKSGSIINFSSIIWRIKQSDAAIYSMAKASIHGLTRTLTRKFGAEGIRINTVSPGAIWTERQMRLWYTPEVEKEIMYNQSLKQKITPEDVARLVLFLGSDESSKCTGQEFIIDGGWA